MFKFWILFYGRNNEIYVENIDLLFSLYIVRSFLNASKGFGYSCPVEQYMQVSYLYKFYNKFRGF